MCRDIANGGRRCPSHTNPVLIATRNAKRREVYAKVKDANKREDFNLVSSLQELGLTSTPVTGENVDNNYLIAQKISGVIDYTALNENSHKAFGFNTPGENPTPGMDDMEALDKISEKEVEALSDKEKASLRFFTSMEYTWVNSSVYKTEKHFEENQTFDEHEEYLSGPRLDKFHSHDTSFSSFKSPEVLKEITSTMDSALSKGAGEQKIVYRGLSSRNPLFAESGLSNYGNAVKDYVEKNMKLGQEIVMDGYQSTSTSVDRALSYTPFTGGLILQILTPSGVNVTSISEFRYEKEVILPRSSRYMVVGVHTPETFRGDISERSGLTVVQLVEIDDSGAVAVSPNTNQQPLTHDQIYKTEED